jgi:tRNA (cytidine32/uridine32-2'-O)-methyltransferase
MQAVLDNIRIVLVATSHSGNIGSTARAMKNMGFSKLILVNPQAEINGDAISMSSGADNILANTMIVPDLLTAIAPCSLVLGASARTRRIEATCKSVRAAVADVISFAGQEIAIVFGSEHSGLTNEELNMCHIHINIPTVKTFSSLNLSQAVQVVCYELYTGLLQVEKGLLIEAGESKVLANLSELEGLQQHFAAVMQQIEFLNPAQPKKLESRMRRLLLKANLEPAEVNILRGFLATVAKKIT